MKTKPIAALLAAALAATMLMAQEPAPKASPKPRPAPEKPEARPEPPPRPGQLANVRIDVKVTDERPGQPPVTKLVSLTVADRRDGFIRSAPQIQLPGFNAGPLPLNVDASPAIEGARIRLGLGLEYFSVEPASEAKQYNRTEIRERLQLVLEDAKPMRVAQSADAMSERRVSVEVTATILR
ncbi:MAG: hypothetical protein DMF82_11245 [Acidobacteria bacterium]|nr:MAG: hypothetical protein DMF82_11245 [Acidobacteriota bacterium]